MNFFHLALAIIIFSSSCINIQAAQTALTSSKNLSELTSEILLKEIDLERYYLKYKIAANKEPRLRELRYFLGQQASLGLFMAGDIATINDTGKHLDSPENISVKSLKGAIKTELIGSIIGGASSTFELCSNSFTAWKNAKHKRNPNSVKRVIKSRLEELSNLLNEREILVEQQKASPAYRIFVTESTLLKCYRDACLAEFAQIYADLKSYQSSENVYYFLSAAYYSLYSAAAGLAYSGFRNSQYISPSIVTGMIGDGLSILSAPASFFSKKILNAYYSKKIYKQFHEKVYDIDTLSDRALTDLHNCVLHSEDATLAKAGPVRLRLMAYDLWCQRYDEYVSKETEQLRRYNKIALQSVIFGPIISGSFLAQDLLGAAAYYGNKDRLRTANNLTFAGAITAGAGSALGIGASTWYFVDETLNKKRLKKEQKLPEQLLQQRLKTLDEIELMVGHGNSN